MSSAADPTSHQATAFPPSDTTLREAGIRIDERVTLTSLGLWYNWKPLQQGVFFSDIPDQDEFRRLASGEEWNDVGSLRIDGERGGCLVLNLNDDAGRKAIREASLKRPVAAVSVDFCATNMEALRSMDLARLSRHEGEFYLGEQRLEWRDRSQGYPICWVEERGRAYSTNNYAWLGTHPILGHLLEMKESALVAGFPEEGDAALLMLRDDPRRWVNVLLEYTHRFGNESAFVLLGADHVSSLLGCRLWQHLGLDTIHIRRAGYSDRRQGVFPLKG